MVVRHINRRPKGRKVISCSVCEVKKRGKHSQPHLNLMMREMRNA